MIFKMRWLILYVDKNGYTETKNRNYGDQIAVQKNPFTENSNKQQNNSDRIFYSFFISKSRH